MSQVSGRKSQVNQLHSPNAPSSRLPNAAIIRYMGEG